MLSSASMFIIKKNFSIIRKYNKTMGVSFRKIEFYIFETLKVGLFVFNIPKNIHCLHATLTIEHLLLNTTVKTVLV